MDSEHAHELPDSGHKWESLNLKENLVKGVYSDGFEYPYLVQRKSIPHIVSGLNLRVQAQAGAGKSTVYVVGTLQSINENTGKTQCLVLVSTREIAVQIAYKYKVIGAYMDVSMYLLAEGTVVQEDKIALSNSPKIVIGTPRRISHMIDEGSLKTDFVKIFVIDEFDKILSAGFEENLYEIHKKLEHPSLQTLMFSDSYQESELNIIKNIVKDPVDIDLGNEKQSYLGIKQFYVDIGPCKSRGSANAREQEVILKVQTFLDIFKNQTLGQTMIFISKKSDASVVHKTLKENNCESGIITSDLDRNERSRELEEFKSGKNRILVYSGLYKRGTDIQGLSLVVCLDVPNNEIDYINRVRSESGRYGRNGCVLHILNSQEKAVLFEIAETLNDVIVPFPTDFNLDE